MRLALVFLLLFLMIFASNSFCLYLQEHTKETGALSKNSRSHITAVSKKGGGGGGRGVGGGGGGRGGGRGRGKGATFGAAGAAGVVGATGARSHHRQNRSSSATAQLGLTLPTFLLGLGVYFIQF